MFTDSPTTNNDLFLMTWYSVLVGTLIGAVSGVVMVLMISSVPAFLFLLFIGLMSLVGAGSSFLGSTAGLISRQRKYALVTGLLSGVILGLISLSIISYVLIREVPLEVLFSPLVICVVIGGFAGALGSYYSTTVQAAKYKSYLSACLIVLVATGITLVSLTYVRPQDCERLCVKEPCPSGSCLAGVQRAGFPLPFLQDNQTGSSPTTGWGVVGFRLAF